MGETMENNPEPKSPTNGMDPAGLNGAEPALVNNTNNNKKIKPKAPPKPKKKQQPTVHEALLEEQENSDQDSTKLYPTSHHNTPIIINSSSSTLPNNNGRLGRTTSPILVTLPRAGSTTPGPVYDIPYLHRPHFNTLPGNQTASKPLPKNGAVAPSSPLHSTSSNNGQPLTLDRPRHPPNLLRAHPNSSTNNPSIMTAPAAVAALANPSGPPKQSRPPSAGSRSAEYQRLHRVGYLRGKVFTDSYKVIAFICGLFAAILLVMGLASSEWLIATGYRQGLFVYCVGKEETEATVPFVSASNPEKVSEGCHRIDLNQQAYTLVAAAFCVVSLLVDVFATLLTVLGLRCRDPNKKYKYYRIAVYVMALALVTVLVALVVYPVCFAQIMDQSKRPFWEFGWAYGVGWGASIFLFGGVILLLCDKESEEIYYKERTIVQYADTNNKV